MTKAIAPEALHPIQVAARRSGVSADLLRAWEKRYLAVSPRRDESGRRLYSDADIERLRLVREAVEGGRRVGDVAGLPAAGLTALIEEDRRQATRPAPVRPQPDSDRSPLLGDAVAAVRRADSVGLRSALTRAMVVLGPHAFIQSLATPLMHEVGVLWERGELSPGHEHIASEVMRRVVTETMEMVRSPDGAPVLVVATPSGQRHELGALLVATLAAIEGWRVTYLGTDLPGRYIGRVAMDVGARAVALSVTAPDAGLAEELAELRAVVGPQVAVFVGGQQSGPAHQSARHATIVSDLESFRALLGAAATA